MVTLVLAQSEEAARSVVVVSRDPPPRPEARAGKAGKPDEKHSHTQLTDGANGNANDKKDRVQVSRPGLMAPHTCGYDPPCRLLLTAKKKGLLPHMTARATRSTS